MIDVMFTTAKDVESATESEIDADDEAVDEASTKTKGVWQFTDAALLQSKRDEIIAALGNREEAHLIKKSRALYWNPTKNVRAACTVSKRYMRKAVPYWYAYHPPWDEFLGEGAQSFVILGCMDRKEAFALPLVTIRSCLDGLNTSERDDGEQYWHLHLSESSGGEISLILPKRKTSLLLTPFTLKL
jgi:hypothetical protein